MKASIYSNKDLIGTTELIVLDEFMGVVSGKIKTTNEYENIRRLVWKSNEKGSNRFRILDALRLNVQLENGYFIDAAGGISILDVEELPNEDIELEIAGTSRLVVDDYIKKNSTINQLKEPWDFISIQQKISYEDELKRELGKDVKNNLSKIFLRKNTMHPLFNAEFCALANTSGMNDDVLFSIIKKDFEATFALVHLTYKGKVEINENWPRVTWFKDFEEFKNTKMRFDNLDWNS